jgi:SulP family sulfate permease
MSPSLHWSDKPEPSAPASVSGGTSTSTITTVTQRPPTLPEQSQPALPHLVDRSDEASTPTSILSPASNTPKTNMHVHPFTSGSGPMLHFGSPASLRPPSESTPLLHYGTPRSSMQNAFGSSSPSLMTLDSQKRQHQHLDLNELPRYTPSPRSPSPQLELGIEAPSPAWKRQGLSPRFRMLVDRIPNLIGDAVKSMPAVLLGCLLNVLDSVSCRYIFLSTPFGDVHFL